MLGCRQHTHAIAVSLVTPNNLPSVVFQMGLKLSLVDPFRAPRVSSIARAPCPPKRANSNVISARTWDEWFARQPRIFVPSWLKSLVFEQKIVYTIQMSGGRSAKAIAWFILRRFLITIPLLFGIVTIVFVVTRLIPGDPAYRIAGVFATPEKIATIQEQLGTNRPIWDQYVSYLGEILHGSLGTSISTGNPVLQELLERLPSTLELILLALAFALIFGVVTGAWAARRAGGWADGSVRIVSFVGLSLPDFWLGLLLLYIFFFTLGWAPGPFGQLSAVGPQVDTITGAALIDSILTGNVEAAGSAFRHAVLPVLTLGLIFFAPFARLTRSATIEILQADYMAFGRACGLKPATLRRYAIRAALPPVVTFAGILIAVMIGGAVLVETVFAWNGAAQFAAGSIQKVDYPVIQGFLLLTGVISVLIFLLVDLLYVLIDPRVKL